MLNDSSTERENVENVSIYILKHFDVNHFIGMSMKKICERFILILLLKFISFV
jgi:hypothetical protein